MTLGAATDLEPLSRSTQRLRLLALLLIAVTAATLPTGFHAPLGREAIPALLHGARDPQTLLLALQALLGMVTLVAALGWLRRACTTVRELGAVGLQVTPGMAVLWFFIPFANLFMPYRTVGELWRASIHHEDWAVHRPSRRVGLWWGLHLATFFSLDQAPGLGELSAGLARIGITPTLPAYLPVGDLLLIPTLFLLLHLVGRIEAGQRQWLRRLQGYRPVHGIEATGR